MKALEIVLERAYKKPTYTIGNVLIDGKYFSASMEDADRGLNQQMSVSQIQAIKVYGKTAIPAGRYKVTFTYSPKFAGRTWAKPYGGLVPLINDVKGYDGVRIHPLNTAEDSLGCIGFGLNLSKGRISQSTVYYRKFLDEYFIPAINSGAEVYLTIR